MAKLRHLAITSGDPGKTAAFFKEVFDMQEVRRDSKGQVFLSDGVVNMAILNYKTNDDPDVGAHGPNFGGIHHLGFYIENIEERAKKLEQAGGKRLTPITHVGRGDLFGTDTGMGPGPSNAEVKFSGPEGVIIDMSESGWQGITL